ncbi:unnamed protein product [Rotaria sordida]|uniref:Uncharacterized protein n=1 Tax=Rotaria sordida TaxID=392033 RepID=A0A815KTM9_9BILA|nr:unnamed protein product [Rotaria sordida]CAF1546538.1 unnamed protein product [Rotaria sordida]
MVGVILNLARLSVQEIDETLLKFTELYSNDATAKREIIQFHENYSSDNPIWWYTRGTFIYRLLNRSLGTINVDNIFDFRFYIVDLYHHLAALHRDQSIAPRTNKIVARYWNRPDFISLNDLSRNVGGLVSFNSFLSTTTSLQHQCYPDSKDDILIEIVNIDVGKETAMPFANVAPSSVTADDREILFSWYTPFVVQSVEQSESSYSSVKLQLITKEKLKETLTEIVRPFIGTLCDPERLLGIGRELESNDDNQKAIAYYKKLFKIVLSNDQYHIIDIYEQLDQLYKEFNADNNVDEQFGDFIRPANTVDYNPLEICELISA